MPGYPNPPEGRSFWRDAFAWRQAITGKVLPRILTFAAFAVAVAYLHGVYEWTGLPVTPLAYTGGILALLLVLRTNAGYERWWEARKLWGGIVNQSRNLAVNGLAYTSVGGTTDERWRESFVRWSAAFSHSARLSLRGQRRATELERVLGRADAEALLRADHMPSYVVERIADLLHRARRSGDIGGYELLATDEERRRLIDHIGGSERILKTPLARLASIKVRRFILLYLLGLPLAIASSSAALMAGITVLVAYPLLAIDQIGQELENPFDEARASHLPLDTICNTIEGNLLALLEQSRRAATDTKPAPPVASTATLEDSRAQTG